MANKALATRQRMQFRIEPSQVPAPAKGRGNQAKKVLPDYLTKNKNTKPSSLPAITNVLVNAKSTDKQEKN
ncbi:MAG: hypothetical protein V4495_12825 [Pseudomonadota bacterium]